jgi:Trypsin
MLRGSSSRVVLAFVTGVVVLASVACAGPSQVSFVSNEQPTAAGAPQGHNTSASVHHEHPNGSHDLPNDTEVVEPERPAAETKQERALVHIHGPNGMVCSGVVLGPRVIATAQQCLKGEGRGVTLLAASREYRVEIASSTLTWTNRKAKYAVVPSCDWDDVDVGLLVLSEPAPWVVPLKIASAPGTGGRVQALGFGQCAGRATSMKERVGEVRSRVSEAFVIDVPLCKGDTGGPVVDGTAGDIVGLISHRDDPEGSPLRTTTIARLDTTSARALFTQAQQIADGSDATKAKAVACR